MSKFKLGIKRIVYNQKMRKVRKELGLTQEELADRANICVGYISRIERLKRVPRVTEAKSIAEVLGLSAKELFPDKLYKHLVEKVKSISRDFIVGVEFTSLNAPEVKKLYDPKDVVIEAEMFELVDQALDVLNDRERKIIEMRFGIKDGVTRTRVEVGNAFRTTHERIKQIEKRAFKKLEKYFDQHGIEWEGFDTQRSTC
jgi:RNA polymerase sigma factor (sigma-70 family)